MGVKLPRPARLVAVQGKRAKLDHAGGGEEEDEPLGPRALRLPSTGA